MASEHKSSVRLVVLDRGTMPAYPPPDTVDPDGWDRPLVPQELGPDCLTWRELWYTKAFVRTTDVPIVVGLNRSGLMCSVDSIGAISSAFGLDEATYKALDNACRSGKGTEFLEELSEKRMEKLAEFNQHQALMNFLPTFVELVKVYPQLRDIGYETIVRPALEGGVGFPFLPSPKKDDANSVLVLSDHQEASCSENPPDSAGDMESLLGYRNLCDPLCQSGPVKAFTESKYVK